MANITTQSGSRRHVQRQIRLPLSKAVEIAYKNIRMRLGRSLLVTSGIVLALAFLMSILTSGAITSAMRHWIEIAEKDPELRVYAQERDRLEPSIIVSVQAIRDVVRTTSLRDPASKNAQAVNIREVFGADFPDLQNELGPLPATAAELQRALSQDPSGIEKLRQWIGSTRRLREVKEVLNGPQQLQAMLKANGVPTTPEEILNNKLQTRWIIGLALLVAFVGILNAMLMSVTERFREIGTMKCLGAMDGFIIKLFLIESLFQGVVGTALGILLGLLLSIVSAWGSYGSFAWKEFPMADILQAAAVCLGVGVVLTVAGACYPAWQAARMQPVEAMRVET